MEILNSNFPFNNKPLYNTNITNPETSKNISSLKTAFTSFQNTNPSNKLLSSFEKYKNQKLLNSAQLDSHKCHNCNPHHFHIHHIHIPQERLYEALNLQNVSGTSELMKEVLELKNECRKFREELYKNQKDKKAEDNYIKELENKINNSNDKDNDIYFNRYHDMLDKSFEVLNSVSKKCYNEDGKTKGGIYYYKDKNDDYNKLIEAQKNWIDNLQENYNFNLNIPNQNRFSFGKTYQINDHLYNNRNINNNKNKTLSVNNNSNEDDNKDSNTNFDQNLLNYESLNNPNIFNNSKHTNNHQNKLYFDSKRNNNKGYIIKKGEKNNNNQNEVIETDTFKKKYNTEPNNNNKQKLSPSFNIINKSNDYFSYQENNNNNEEENNDNNNSDIKEKNNIDNLNNNEENLEKNKDKIKEENNPLNERYLIIDQNGNPILINGEKILGIELLPLIDKDGKEVIDENGNIILIGPKGDPKKQDELEPIILDNDKILVNEENKPFLGFDGVPLINSEGEPITGPDELNDEDNKKIKSKIGLVAKDSNGNPIKIKLNITDNNQNNKKNQRQNNLMDYNKLRPLLDLNGFPILDANNNFIILDKDNKPVQDKEIKVLLSPDGKPILSETGKPILIDSNEKPLNTDDINNKKIDNELKIMKDKTKNKRKNKKDKKIMNYSECNPESLKKINFIRPDKDPFYDDLEYKSTCFACDVGCSVSRSGYSCMNYSPYNNLIKRRNITPIKIINDIGKKNKIYSKQEMKQGRYYLS